VSGADSNPATVTTTLRGSAGEPELLATPGGADFEPGVVGGVGGRVAIGIDQIGFLPTRATRISVGGAHPDDFAVLDQSCTGRYLNPGASCAVEIEFQPRDDGYRNALLLVTTETGAYTAAVLGGLAEYAPRFETVTDSVEPGDTLGIGLHGFPADAMVSVGFDDGSQPFETFRTNGAGSMLAIIQLPSRLRAGEQRLVAAAGESTIATVTIDVSAQPHRAAAPLPGLGLG
jgi:hypothetical protein